MWGTFPTCPEVSIRARWKRARRFQCGHVGNVPGGFNAGTFPTCPEILMRARWKRAPQELEEYDPMRKAFADTLNLLAAQDPRLIFLTGDLGFQVFDEFKERFPG